MKVYSRVVLDHRGDILDEDSFEYDGVVTECKGGGSSTTTNVDYEYNSRMAAVAERQQDMAEEYFDFWRTDQKGLDRQKIEAQAEILPHQTTFDIAELQSQNELLPYQTAHQKALLEAETSLVPQKTELSKQQGSDSW